VKIKFFGKEVILIVCFLFLFSALDFAQGKDVVRTRGRVASLNVAGKILTVGETDFVWNQNTMFYDETGSPITADRLKKGMRVFIEATVIPRKPCVIKTLRILPK
jgi:hypothetical protein